MRCQRLARPPLDPARVAELYSEFHHHRAWTDHRLRVPLTTQVANWMIDRYDLRVVADLSCGDGAMLRDTTAAVKIYGDLVPHPSEQLDYIGSIQETIHDVLVPGFGADGRTAQLDMLICAETVEHLSGPHEFLGDVRKRARTLVLSTPVGSWDDPTPGHYWAWDREYVDDMLREAGFEPVTYVQLEFASPELPHDFGIWGCA